MGSHSLFSDPRFALSDSLADTTKNNADSRKMENTVGILHYLSRLSHKATVPTYVASLFSTSALRASTYRLCA